MKVLYVATKNNSKVHIQKRAHDTGYELVDPANGFRYGVSKTIKNFLSLLDAQNWTVEKVN
jgi:hypothetical protein